MAEERLEALLNTSFGEMGCELLQRVKGPRCDCFKLLLCCHAGYTFWPQHTTLLVAKRLQVPLVSVDQARLADTSLRLRCRGVLTPTLEPPR
jgi:hypothetical protein